MGRMRRPRLATDEVIQLAATAADAATTSATPRPTASAAASLAQYVRPLVGLVLAFAGVGIAVYTILAATLLIVVQPFGLNAVVVRGAFSPDRIPTGTFVLAGRDAAALGTLDRIAEGYRGPIEASVLEIVTGPTQRVAVDRDGRVTADAAPTGYRGSVSPRVLTDEYLAVCVQGACATGQLLVVDANRIVGEMKGTLNGFSLRQPTSSADQG